MGLSVAHPTNFSSILTEISLQDQEANDAEGLTLPEELTDPEMLKDFSRMGCLPGEAKSFTFMLQEKSLLSLQLTNYLSDINRPEEQKSLDFKPADHLSFKENLIREKIFKVLEADKQSVEGNEKEKESTLSKTQDRANQVLERAVLPKSARQLKETSTLKQQQNQAKSLQHRVQAELSQREQLHNRSDSNRKTTETRQSPHKNERDAFHAQMSRTDKNEENRQEQCRRNKEEEEGFAEGQRQRDQEQPEETEERKKIEKVNEVFAQEFVSYSAEESVLSEIFKLRVSQLDVLILFIEILKLEIRSREQEKIARRLERELQILHMQKVVDNYKSQGQWMMFSSLGSGILAIVSGICPIIGHLKGDWILQKLGSVFSKFRNMKKDQFFKSAAKITFAMSEMYKSTGQIHNTFAEGNRTFDQHMSELYRADWDESTRSMEEIKDNWKGIENFLYQALQMNHDAIRQLYS